MAAQQALATPLTRITPAPSSALQFLSELTAPYWEDTDLRLEVRCLPGPHAPGRGKPPRQWYPLTQDNLTQAAQDCRSWALAWNVYVGVLPRHGEHGTQDTVPYASWLWADVDGGEAGPTGALEMIRQAVRADRLPAPHMAVISGSGVHAYWRLEQPVALGDGTGGTVAREEYKSVLRRVVYAIGGEVIDAHADILCAQAACILRVPDTLNHKQQPAQAVTLLRCRTETPARSFDQWAFALPIPPVDRPRPQTTEPAQLSGVPRWLRQWAETPAQQGSRHSELLRITGWLKRYGLPVQDAIALLRQKAEVSALPIAEAERIWRWAL